MKKITFLIIAILILSGLFLSKGYSGEIELLTSDIECSEDDKIVVHYSLKSTYDFEYPNVTLGFRVVEGEKTIACKEIKVVVPKDADGSELKELVIDVPCDGKKLTLQSAVFYRIKRYKIDEWFAGCN